jgi:aspartyl-tRNA(Asn)/glutamyl-tRNA(Gln) amidotransferase subunit B
MADYGLSAYDAGVLVAEREIAEYFEAVAKERDGKQAANWVMGTLFGALNRAGIGIEQSPVSAAALGALIDRVADGTVSNRAAKDVFEAMVSSGKDADTVIEEQGLRQVSDEGAIAALVDQAIAENPDKVADYRGGKVKLMGWFVGQVMKASGGTANPKAVNQALRARLDG